MVVNSGAAATEGGSGALAISKGVQAMMTTAKVKMIQRGRGLQLCSRGSRHNFEVGLGSYE